MSNKIKVSLFNHLIEAERQLLDPDVRQSSHALNALLDDEFIEINRLLHNKLLALDISHDYLEKLGDHSWDYWVNALNYHFLFFNKNFKNN